MRTLFRLLDGDGREGVDAYLELNGRRHPFELKSTTKTSFSTVRDLGHDHIKKWRAIHWLFSVYDETGTKIVHSFYGSPRLMRKWIARMGEYIGPDFLLADLVPELIAMKELYAIAGKKVVYTLEDARRLHKQQYSKAEYLKQMDRKDGYSPERMLDVVRQRCRYIIERGSTLNNPHIPLAYFSGWDKIEQDHANRLREMVRAEFRAGVSG
jgi:hypothetical protein